MLTQSLSIVLIKKTRMYRLLLILRGNRMCCWVGFADHNPCIVYHSLVVLICDIWVNMVRWLWFLDEDCLFVAHAASTPVTGLLEEVFHGLFAHCKNWKSSVGSFCVLCHNWHVQLGNALSELASLVVRNHLILAHFNIIRSCYAILPHIEHGVHCIDEYFLCILPPIFFCLVLGVGCLETRVLRTVDLDAKFLDIRCELLFYWFA